MSKDNQFIPPIDLPNGKQIITLEQAGRYIMALSKTERDKPEWEFAGRRVVGCIAGKDFEMHARIAFTRALGGIPPGSAPLQPPRDASKEVKFRNYKKRDPWR